MIFTLIFFFFCLWGGVLFFFHFFRFILDSHQKATNIFATPRPSDEISNFSYHFLIPHRFLCQKVYIAMYICISTHSKAEKSPHFLLLFPFSLRLNLYINKILLYTYFSLLFVYVMFFFMLVRSCLPLLCTVLNEMEHRTAEIYTNKGSNHHRFARAHPASRSSGELIELAIAYITVIIVCRAEGKKKNGANKNK
jgi:hypothetical protein